MKSWPTLFLPLFIYTCLIAISPAWSAELPKPTFTLEWSSAASPANFSNPGAIAVSPNGKVYVADGGSTPRVVIFSQYGGYIGAIPFSQSSPYTIAPDGIAVLAGQDSSVWIYDVGGFLQRWQGTVMTEWRSYDLGGSLPGASFLAIAAGPEYVFLAATSILGYTEPNNQGVGIARIDSSGTIVNRFHSKWYSDEYPGNITAMAADVDHNVYTISEYRRGSPGGTLQRAVRKYSSVGDTLKSWPLPAGARYGLAVDRSGAIYYSKMSDTGTIDVIAADSMETTFQYVDAAQTDSLRNPRGLATDDACALYVADDRNRVVKLSLDADGDGLCSSWERDGLLTPGPGKRFYLQDAQVLMKDLYVEVDCMDSLVFDYQYAIPKVIAAFAAKSITIHIAVDETTLTRQAFTHLWNDFVTIKAARFGTQVERDSLLTDSKALAVRYGLFAHRNPNNETGRGEYGGNDFYVTLGRYRHVFGGKVPWQWQAGTFMHELGHNLDLYHGGRDTINHKPNYISVMNYSWQNPTQIQQNWPFGYSGEVLDSLYEGHLVDSVGMAKPPDLLIPISPVEAMPNGTWRARTVLSGLLRPGKPYPIDWDDRDMYHPTTGFVRTPACDSCDVNRWPGEKRVDDEGFQGFNDWANLKFLLRHHKAWQRGVSENEPTDAVEMIDEDMLAWSQAIGDCNENGVADTEDIITGASLDADRNHLPDECDPPRVFGLADTVWTCPGGDRDSLKFSVDFEDIYVTGSGVDNHMRIDSLGVGVRAWRDDGRLMALGDTLREYLRETPDSTDRLTGYFALGRLSGCGYLGFSVWSGDSLVVRNQVVQVISADQDGHSIGSVDRHDAVLLLGASSGSMCWDLNMSGMFNYLEEVVVLAAHIGDHIPRKLLSPNGGESLAPGAVVPISWQRGYGDSARVTIRLKRESTGDSLTVVADEADDGAYNWTVPSPLPVALVPDSTYRLQIIHTAGYYKVDNMDVGWDKSDTTFTIRPRKPLALSRSMGRNSAALSWTEAGQAGSNADAYQVGHKMITTITDANFASTIAYSTSPGDSGTVHCVEIDTLTKCKTYSFGIRTRENGVWSLVSVINGNTTCSGFQVAICEGGGLLAGGGGGEEGLRAPGLSTMSSGSGRVHDEGQVTNSLLPGALSYEHLDYLALAAPPALVGGAHELLLRQTGGRQADVRQLSLGVVDHAPGTVAVSAKDGVLVGSSASALSVSGSRIQNGSELASGTGEGHRTEAGEIVLVDLGRGEGAALILEVRGDLRAASADSVGILVQRPNAESAWETIETVYPRREFAQTAVPTQGGGLLRLVFLRDYEVRALRKLSDIATGQIQPLTSLGSVHSRLGEAPDSSSLVPGDSLRLRFSQAETGSATRDYFLSIRGRYRVAEGQGPADTMELTASNAPILSFALGAARPNPSSGDVVISYTLARDVRAELRIFDVAGREVRTLVSGEEVAGAREAAWDGRDAHGRKVSSGVYFYRLRAGDWQSERKLIVLQ